MRGDHLRERANMHTHTKEITLAERHATNPKNSNRELKRTTAMAHSNKNGALRILQ